MEEFIEKAVQPHFNYWAYVIIMMIGLWALIAKQNLIKKLIGMSIFQTAIILLYVSAGVKEGATIPIVDHHGDHSAEHHQHAAGEDDHDHKDETHAGDAYAAKKSHLNADDFANPLPHVLMLTAIVVGVSTLGVALAISQAVFRSFGTLEEGEILEKIRTGDYNS